MPTAVEILTAGGIQRADEVIELANAAGLDLAAAATMLMKESGGGFNIWGHDGVTVAPNTYVKGGAVTQANYAAYKAAVTAKRAGRQGCGPGQLTDGGLQAEADALAGCWDWRSNITVAFGYLAGLIRSRGLSGGFRAYNAGPSARGDAGVAYAADSMAIYGGWKTRLSGASAAPSVTWVDVESTLPVLQEGDGTPPEPVSEPPVVVAEPPVVPPVVEPVPVEPAPPAPPVPPEPAPPVAPWKPTLVDQILLAIEKILKALGLMK